MKKGFLAAIGAAALSGNVALGQALPDTASLKKSAAPAPATAPPAQLPPAVAPPASPCGALADACGYPGAEADPWGAGGRFNFSADYLLWWVRKAPSPGALVTAGSVNDFVPGALGQPGTHSLFGDDGFNYHAFSGLRLGASAGLTPGLALEGSYFVLERRSDLFSAASDAGGNPIIARPVTNAQSGSQNSYVSSYPGFLAGRTDVATHTQLQGYEINLAANLTRDAARSLDVIVGYRYLNLREDLTFRDTLTPLANDFLTFQGASVNPPGSTVDFDDFRTRNHFYGGQVGGRWQQALGRLSLGVTGKVALGATDERVDIGGASTLLVPGATAVTVPGGILAQTSNGGSHSHSAFAVVPEVGLNLGWQITPNLVANFGYTFLYWSEVARPGAQIDPRVNASLVPTDQDFGLGPTTARPGFAFHSSDFWAQGINFGLLLRF